MQVIAQIWILLLGGLGVAYGLDKWVSNGPCFCRYSTEAFSISQVAGLSRSVGDKSFGYYVTALVYLYWTEGNSFYHVRLGL